MPIHINIEIRGKVDTLMLWSLIQRYEINLTELDDVTYIYGEIALHNAGELIARCALFGDLIVQIKGGGSNGQKEAAQETE